MDTLYMGDKEQEDVENIQGFWALVIKQVTKSLTEIAIPFA